MDEIIQQINQIIGYIDEDIHSFDLLKGDVERNYRDVANELKGSTQGDDQTLMDTMAKANDAIDNASLTLKQTQMQLEALIANF